VELLAHDADGLAQSCARLLVGAGATESPALPKLARALGLGGLEPADGSPPELHSWPAPGDVIRLTIAKSLTRYVNNDPGVVLGEDPEAVHQARVALRHLRGDLRTFRRLLDRDWADHLRQASAPLASALGAVRDVDVMCERLLDDAARLDGADGDALAWMTARLGDQREQARSDVLAMRRAQPFVDLLDTLVGATREPRLRPAAKGRPEDVLPPVLIRAWRPLRRSAAAAMYGHAEASDLHQVRILTKRFRYAAEALAPGLGDQAKSLAEAAAGLQDVLGELQDARVTMDWLEATAKVAPANVAFTAGQLRNVEQRRAARARAHWTPMWRDHDEHWPKRLQVKAR
jgi:CHAD domain-containing protein